MSTELIEKLSRDLKPAPPSAPPVLRAFFWALGSAIVLSGILLIAPHGPLVSPWIAFISLAGISIVSAWAALEGARPGTLQSKVPTLWRWMWIAGFVGILVWKALATGEPDPMAPLTQWGGVHCTLSAIGFGLLPGIALACLIRREAPTRLARTGRLLGLSMAAAGAAALAFCCRDGRSMHVLLWHGLPLALLAALGSAVGRRLFRW